MSYCQGCATRDAAIADLTREAQDLRASHSLCEQRVRALVDALQPFAALGGKADGICAAYHDMPSDVVIYENSGKVITAGDVRTARQALVDALPIVPGSCKNCGGEGCIQCEP